MLSSRPIAFNSDIDIALQPNFNAKTPGRKTVKNRAALQENALYSGAKTVLSKKHGLQSPFKPGTSHGKKPLMSMSVTRPLQDKTPFPNRVAPAGAFGASKTPATKGFKLSKLALLVPEPEQPEPLSPDAAPLLRPSSTRKSLRGRLSGTFKTPMTKGDHWNVSPGDLEMELAAEPTEQAREDVAQAEVEDDEIEYMPPTAVELPFEPPFELPDYKSMGKNLFVLGHAPLVNDALDVYYSADIEEQLNVSEIALACGSTRGSGRLEELELSDLDDDSPFRRKLVKPAAIATAGKAGTSARNVPTRAVPIPAARAQAVPKPASSIPQARTFSRTTTSASSTPAGSKGCRWIEQRDYPAPYPPYDERWRASDAERDTEKTGDECCCDEGGGQIRDDRCILADVCGGAAGGRVRSATVSVPSSKARVVNGAGAAKAVDEDDVLAAMLEKGLCGGLDDDFAFIVMIVMGAFRGRVDDVYGDQWTLGRMGFCFSCCTRRRRRSVCHSDREPLLSPSNAEDLMRPPKTVLEKVADVAAALNAGKLPSQEQLGGALRGLLASGVLDVDRGGLGVGEAGEAGERAVRCAREACEALLRFGVEKNDDDIVQELVYRLRQVGDVPVHADVLVDTAEAGTVDAEAIARELPSSGEASADAAALVRSLYHLVFVLATSAAFRLVLSDMLLIARETTADVAAHIGHVAGAVEKAAEEVEETVRPGGGTMEDVQGVGGDVAESVVNELSGSGPVSEGVVRAADAIQQEGAEAVKEAVLRRVQETMEQAHRNRSFRAALRTLLALSRKYAAKASAAAAAAAVAAHAQAPTLEFTPLVWAEPPLAQALAYLRTFLERLASGRSLGGLLQAVRDAVEVPLEALEADEDPAALGGWCAALGAWLESALADPAYAASEAGKTQAGALYERVRGGGRWARRVRAVLDELDGFVAAMAGDRTTRGVVDALSALCSAVAGAGAGARGAVGARARWARGSVVEGVVVWVLRRVMRVVSAIPMPRVEYVSDTVEAAVDALLLSAARTRSGGGEALGVAAALVPDRVRWRSWTETVVEVEVDHAGPVGRESGAATGIMALFTGTGGRPARGSTHDERGRAGTGASRVSMQTRTRARVRVEGVRVCAHDVGYYVYYKGARVLGVRVPCTAYEDEGLVSVDVGGRDAAGTGLSVDVELEFDADADTDTDTDMEPTGTGRTPVPLFGVTGVHVDIPGLAVHLARTRHAVVNALFVRPLAGPVARAALGRALEGQVRAGLEAVALFGGRVRERAGRRRVGQEGDEGGSGVWVWAEAVWEELGSVGGRAGEDDDGDGVQGEGEALAETHTRATAQGVVVRTTVGVPSRADAGGSESCAAGAVEESVLAIGIGAQVLPGKGGPYGVARAPAHAFEGGVEGVVGRGAEEAREAAEDVVRAEERVEGAVREGVGRAREVREEVEEAGARAEVRGRVEGRRRGWRSRAFDAFR
ncbi:hypothetical protein BC628DRAFT_1341855 [Trametes gibbosa]|nr:hypothetical protein BC628DRAFT_1341855 [Trametes gibbosa]